MATPPPIASIKYLRDVGELWKRKFKPAAVCVSTYVGGDSGCRRRAVAAKTAITNVPAATRRMDSPSATLNGCYDSSRAELPEMRWVYPIFCLWLPLAA